MSTENTVPSSEIPVPEEKKGLDPRIAFVLMIIMIICALLIGANKAWKKNHSGVVVFFQTGGSEHAGKRRICRGYGGTGIA